MIRPIETYYNGFRFRSRLEARWAVFFDAMKIPYEYEPEGYKFEDDTLYLPDFRIQVRHRSYTDEWEPVFVEIKGLMSPRDKQKIEKLSEYYPVIVLGELPANEKGYFDWFHEHDGFHSYRYMDGDEYPAAFSIYEDIPWICGPDHDQYDGGKEMNAALLKARQARFEHGETPSRYCEE